MNPCRLCGQSLELLLDFGPQPLCNRFLPEPSAAEVRYPLQLGQCPSCGLLQLIQPVPAAILRPPKPMRYNEAESHLDRLVDRLTALPGVAPEARVCGLTGKDASTIDRLKRRGFANAACLDPRRDLGVEDAAAGLETIQERISAGALDGLANHREACQLVIARHILEHAHDLRRFVDGVRGLLAPGGYLVFEVPDFTNSLLEGNYSTLWEEHVVYLTKATFPAVLQRLGFQVRETLTYPSPIEDLLVGVVQAGEQGCAAAHEVDLAEERARAQAYAARLPAVRDAWARALAGERGAGGQVALLGAGHPAIMFLNLLRLQGAIDFAVDDDPAKCGWWLPGSHLPVCPSEALYARPARLCLISVAAEQEDKVLRRHRRFLESGGRLASIFPGSELAFSLPLGQYPSPLRKEGIQAQQQGG